MNRGGLRWVSLMIVSGAVGLSQVPAGAGDAVPPSGRSATLRANEKEVQSRIAGVAVYSDRALVRRAANLPLEGGRQWVVLPALPVTIDDASVRAKIPAGAPAGYRILSLEVRTDFREKFTKEEAEKLTNDLRDVQKRIQAVQDRLNNLQTEEGLVQNIQIQPPPQSKDNPKPRDLFPEGWAGALKFVEDRVSSIQAARRDAQKEIRDLQREAAEVQSKLSQVATYRRLAEKAVAIEVEAPAGASGPAPIEVSYVLPQAAWYPAYDVRVQPKQGQVEITYYGVIQQMSGEDWREVDLELSTAMPATGADIPELTKWVVKEAEPQEIVLRYENKQIAARRERLSEEGEEAKREADVEMPEGQAASESLSSGAAGWGDKGGRRNRALKGGGKMPPKMTAQSSAPAPGPQPPAFGEGEYATYAGGTGPDPGAAGLLGSEASFEKAAKADDQLAQRLSWAPYVPCPLPAVSAGGYDFKFKAVRPDTIPSDGKAHKTVLATKSYPVELFHETAPVMEKLSFLKGKFKNTEDLPFLAGPARVFLDTDFVGELALKTISPTESLNLSLGADENVSVKREEKEVTAEKGMFTAKKETRTDVTITVKNGKADPVKLHVFDRLPYTGNEDIQVALAAASPRPEEKRKGLLEFVVELKPGEERKVTFAYTVTRPALLRVTKEIQPPEEDGN